jgi:hypothetical protein
VTVTLALFRAFVAAFMIGLGVGVLFGVLRRLVYSILRVHD